MKKNHRDLIKSARKDLGEEVKEKIKMFEEKLRKTETVCDKPPLLTQPSVPPPVIPEPSSMSPSTDLTICSICGITTLRPS